MLLIDYYCFTLLWYYIIYSLTNLIVGKKDSVYNITTPNLIYKENAIKILNVYKILANITEKWLNLIIF